LERRDVLNVRDLDKKVALFEASSCLSACTSDGSNIEKFVWGLWWRNTGEQNSSSARDMTRAALVMNITTWTDLNTNLGPVVRCRWLTVWEWSVEACNQFIWRRRICRLMPFGVSRRPTELECRCPTSGAAAPLKKWPRFLPRTGAGRTVSHTSWLHARATSSLLAKVTYGSLPVFVSEVHETVSKRQR
jgi:hypothetical protein